MTNEHFFVKMEQNQVDQSIRLKKLIKALNLNQSSFAKTLGMTQSNISRMVTGENKVSVEVLNRIADVHEQVNLHWLLTGHGEMLFEKGPNVDELPGDTIAKGKGTLEERLEWLEETIRGLMKGFKE